MGASELVPDQTEMANQDEVISISCGGRARLCGEEDIKFKGMRSLLWQLQEA